MSKKKWSDEELREAVKTSTTKSEIIQKLGLKVRPGNYKTLDKYIKLLNLDTSHLLGKAHGKSIQKNKYSLDEILVENSTYERHHLKARLLKNNLLENKCADCGLQDLWNNKPITLILDHINGINNDNRLENLRFLCPNCNSQTSTFCRGDWKKPESNKCLDCDTQITKKALRCSRCDGLTKRNQCKISWPEDLTSVLEYVKKHGFAAAGRLYNCSDNSVKKMLKRNNLI